MSTIRRVNLLGGPGSGKSTTAAWLFSQLKLQVPSLEIQLVHEWVKPWANEKRKIKGFDQFYIFARQLALEESMLRNGVDVLVTDSPLLLNVCYSQRNCCVFMPELRVVANQFEEEYPSVNIILDRSGVSFYQTQGRYETLAQAKQFDALVYDVVSAHDDSFILSGVASRENILRAVLARLQVAQ